MLFMRNKILMLLALITLAISAHIAGLDHYLSLAYIQKNQVLITNFSHEHAIFCILLMCLVYLIMALLQLPGITMITLLFGALFGPIISTFITLVLGTLNAFIVLILSRYFFHDYFQQKYHKYLKHFNAEFQTKGGIYIFLLHITPILPYQLVNILAGLTKVKMLHFIIATVLGIIPHAVIFSCLGSAIWQISSIKDLFTPQLLFLITLCGIVPLGYMFFNLKQTKPKKQ